MEPHLSRDELAAYLENRLDERADAEAASHLEACGACADILRELTAADPNRPAGRFPVPGPVPTPLRGRLHDLARAFGAASGLPPELAPEIRGYEIIKFIGRGGMGAVYSALDVARRRVVALKVIRRQEFASDEEVARFRREAEAARTAGAGAGIVPIYEVGECEGVHYLAMAYVEGGTLADHAKDLVADPRAAARLVEQVARTAHRLHALGLCHRDIKPENVLLHCTGAVADAETLLTDFGLAKRRDQSGLTQTGAIVGTPAYMAPEQLDAANRPTPAMDIYALGATLYFCLTRSVPLPAETPYDQLRRLKRDYPSAPRALNPSVPRPLQTICLKCLEKEPRRRYATAEAIADDLRRFLDGRPIRARPPGPHRRAGRWVGAHPWATGILLALAALSGGGAVFSVQHIDAANARAGTAEKERQVAEAEAALQREQHARADEAAAAQARLAHGARVSEARVAARRGDWATALTAYQSAIDDGQPDRPRLRVERLPGFFAAKDRAALLRELDDLEAGPALGRLAAQVRLMRGAATLCSQLQQTEGRALVRQALAARDDLFSRADVAYAEALSASHPRPVERALREALQQDPLHYLANIDLLVVLTVTGQFDEARRQSAFVRSLFPDSPMPLFANALAALMAGDRPGMRERLRELEAHLGPGSAERSARLRAYCEALADVLGAFSDLDAALGVGIGGYLRFAAQLPRMQGLAGPALEPIPFSTPCVGLFFDALGTLVEAYGNVLRSNPEEGYRNLLRASAENPEALILCLAVANRLPVAAGHLSANRIAEARQALEVISDLAERAATAPTLMPRSPHRYFARAAGALADVALLRFVPAPNRHREDRLRANLFTLIADGRAWPKDREKVVPEILKMFTAPTVSTAEWQRDTPEGEQRYRDRHRRLFQLGRMLVEDWQAEDPTSAAPGQWLTKLNQWAEANPFGPVPGGPKK